MSVGNWLAGEPDNLMSLISAGLVAGGLFFTGRQWQADVAQKRSDASAREMQHYIERLERFRTSKTRAAIMILLNYDRDVIIRDHVGPERVSWEQAAFALVPGAFRHYLYEPELTAIRDCFNDLLDGMDRLEHLQREGLLRNEDVDHICEPLIRRIADDPQFASRSIARNFRLYTLWRHSAGVARMFDRYGFNLKSSRASDIAALRDEIAEGKYGDCVPTGWGDLFGAPRREKLLP